MSAQSRFLKLSPGYFVLWLVLMFVVGSKVFFLRGFTPEAVIGLGIFGIVMLAGAYLGAWLIWTFSGKDQRTGELSYLAIMTVFFLVRTVMLYREGFAAL
jgi:hypothetical protein